VPRKRQLEVGKRIWIGTECENRWNELGRAQALEREYAERDKIAAGRGAVGSARRKLDDLYGQLAKAPRFGPLHNQLISDIRTLKDQMRHVGLRGFGILLAPASLTQGAMAGSASLPK